MFQHLFAGVSPCRESVMVVVLPERSHAPLAIDRVPVDAGLGSLRRVAAYAQAVEEICANLAVHGTPALVAIRGYDMPAYRPPHVMLIELGALLRFRMAQCGWRLVEVPAGTLRKFTTGEGQASPDQVIGALARTYGQRCYTTVEAEAYGLAQAARCLMRGSDYPASWRKVLTCGVCRVPMPNPADWPGRDASSARR